MTLLNGMIEGGVAAPEPFLRCLPVARLMRFGSTFRKTGMDASVSERRLSVWGTHKNP